MRGSRATLLPAALNEKGERMIWVERAVVDRLAALRRPGESYSDVILRLVEIEGRGGKWNR